MAIHYPDVMNDLTDARNRFEAGCVQYLAEFEAPTIPAGGVARLVVTLQNAVDTPARLAVRLGLPRLRGKARRLGDSLFQIEESVARLTLSEGEVGQLLVPVGVAEVTPPDSYDFQVHVESVARYTRTN